MTIVATDLDRTLFPNGGQEYDNTMADFTRLIEKNGITLVYVTGRNEEQALKGMERYSPPEPKYLVAEVGTRVYSFVGGSFAEDSSYIKYIDENTRNWNRTDLLSRLESLKQLTPQEDHNQNRFKISFYLHDISNAEAVVAKAEELAALETPDAHIIYSIDETKGLGLVDVLPKKANKLEALEFVRRKIGAEKDDIMYAGDSGNDLIPLTAGYKAVLVKNAIDEVRQHVKDEARRKGFAERVYFAEGGLQKGGRTYNGNYVSGVIEGLYHFGIVE
jgi:sucrose-6-phosphatase